MTHELEKRGDAALERPASVYDVFQRMALDPAIDPARIAALMELQIKAEDRNAEREFNAALARAIARMPRIRKDGTIDMGSKGSMPYATIENIDRVIRPIYTEEGLSLNFTSEPSPDGIIRVGILRHLAGHHIESRMQFPPDKGPGRNDLTARGSSMSYADRYITRGFFNLIHEGEDDDGTAGDYIGEKQIMAIEDFLNELGADVLPKLLDFLGVKAVSEINKAAYRPAIGWLSAKRRQMGAKGVQ